MQIAKLVLFYMAVKQWAVFGQNKLQRGLGQVSESINLFKNIWKNVMLFNIYLFDYILSYLKIQVVQSAFREKKKKQEITS